MCMAPKTPKIEAPPPVEAPPPPPAPEATATTAKVAEDRTGTTQKKRGTAGLRIGLNSGAVGGTGSGAGLNI